MTFEAWFNAYVWDFMLRDVSREIAAAQSGEPAANVLCAIGLLTHTEVLGRELLAARQGPRDWKSRPSFETFFDELGPQYIAFRQDHDAYDIFRNSLVHHYKVKKPATIAMLGDDHSVSCGVFYHDAATLAAARAEYQPATEEEAFWKGLEDELGIPVEGRYFFVVQRYFRDFVVAAAALHEEIVGHRHPLIHVYAPDRLGMG